MHQFSISKIAEQQGVLADYNLLVDKLNTDTDRLEVEQEAAELKAKNDEEQKVVETLFEARREKERIAEQLELEIEAERNMADNLVAAMNPEIRDKYLELKDANTAYQVMITIQFPLVKGKMGSNNHFACGFEHLNLEMRCANSNLKRVSLASKFEICILLRNKNEVKPLWSFFPNKCTFRSVQEIRTVRYIKMIFD